MKVEKYVCTRCGREFNVEYGKQPPTVEHWDGRFSNEEKETVHLCDDCWLTFLYFIGTHAERNKAFDELAEKFSKQDEEEEG